MDGAPPLARPVAVGSPPSAWVERVGEYEFSGELFVRPRQDLTNAARARAIAAIARHPHRRIETTDEFILSVGGAPQSAGAGETRVARELLATGLFAYACPNWILYPVGTPNDPLLADQWHHATMQSTDAWEIHRADRADEPIVAVTDTGIVAHADLANRVPGFNSVSDTAEADGANLTDIHGHGTHVAGCAAAAGDNGAGVAGMGWNLRIMPIRVSEAANGGASMDNLLQGIQWAAEHGAKVISASYSGIGHPPIDTTGAYARSLGANVLWAAGNSAVDHASWDFGNVLVIGASDQTDGRAGFSSYGRGVDLFAPGVAILSSTRDGGYQAWSGTSMATPVANGALALIRSANALLTPEHAEHVLLHSCDPWGLQRNDVEFGFGRINLARAVERAVTALDPQPPIAYPDRVRAIAGGSARVAVLANDWDANMDALEVLAFDAKTNAGASIARDPGDPSTLVIDSLGPEAGEQRFEYTLREPLSGATASAEATIEVVAPIRAWDPEDVSLGLEVAYYELPALNALPEFGALEPYLTGVSNQVLYPSTGGNFAGSGRADLVGAVFTGWLVVPQSDFWTLSTSSDDGSRLWLDDQLVVDNDGLHGMVTRSATLPLEAGMHEIRLEFFENGGGAGLLLQWSGPGVSTQPIAPWNLAHGGTVERADIDRDGDIDNADLSLLLEAWGDEGGHADVNRDGWVGASDLSLLLERWGT